MRVFNDVMVLIPAIQMNTTAKAYVKVQVHGTVGARRLYRSIRKLVKHNYNVKISNNWIKSNCMFSEVVDDPSMNLDDLVMQSQEAYNATIKSE